MTPRFRSKTFLIISLAAWLLAVGAGLRLVLSYEGTPGRAGAAPAVWPQESALRRERGRPTLVMMVHPRCPCSRASLGELALLMAEAQGRLGAEVVFVRPPGLPVSRERSEFWATASRIPGVTVSVDEGGAEAKRFGGETSGQVVLYGADGRLLFSGGITVARGHAGDNDGRRAIAALLAGDTPGAGETPVFGCPIFGEAPGVPAERSCHAQINDE